MAGMTHVLQANPRREKGRAHRRVCRMRGRYGAGVHLGVASRGWARRGCIAADNKTGQLINQQLSVVAYAYTPPGASTTAYIPNTLNQYATVAAVTQSYDNNGNLTGDGTWTYTYDAENRLLTANKTGVSASYLYDPFGRREQKTVGAAITKYGYDGGGVRDFV